MNKWKLQTTFLGLLLLLSCEEVITVEIPDAEIKVVVEGYIEPGKAAQILVSKSSAYFGKVPTTVDELMEMVIDDATVIVSDGTISDTLTFVFDTTAGFFPPFFYQGNSSVLVGEVGKNYDLKIITDSETITATTTIPALVPLDSVWFEVQGNGHYNRGFCWGILDEPDTLGNCYRIMAKRLGKDSKFVPPYGSPFDDKFINGKTFEFYFSKGTEAGEVSDSDDIYYFLVGDTVVVRFCTIDKAHLDFWLSAENDIYSQGSPFATPTTLVTNINGGLGVWGGYGASYDTVICK